MGGHWNDTAPKENYCFVRLAKYYSGDKMTEDK